MIQVLGRAIHILEWLARADAPPRGLGEIAAHIGVSSATCRHILRTLARYGYVVQVAARKGYCLGPMAAMLGRHHRPHESLIRAGQPIVDRVADSTGETALLACLHGSRRVILCHAEGKQTIRVSTDAIVLEDIYGTATGRLLLAFLPESERDALLRDVPPTAPAWGIAGTVDEMRQALSETRRTGYALNPDYDDMAQLALPVHGGSAVVAAIGCFAPVFRFDEPRRMNMLTALRQAATELSAAISGTRNEERR